MEAIKRTLNVRNNAIVLNDLGMFNNKTVEVIILAIPDTTKKHQPDKKELLKFRGAGASGFADTSHNVDGIIYGE